MRSSGSEALGRFFQARHIVVVGASAREGSLGHVLAGNLIRGGFGGKVDFVNPSGGTLAGHSILTSLDEVTGAPDLAVLLVPPRAVPESARLCGERGIRHLIVSTGGFRETGPEGVALEAALEDAAREYGLRIVGPNCVGLIDPAGGLDTSFLGGPTVPAGSIGFASHSGALCASFVEWIRADGGGFARLISLGNQLDLCERDAIDLLADDPRVRVIALYLEGTSDGEALVASLRAAAARKPVIVLKVGRSEAGRRAASSHTGALAGRDAAWDAALRRAGVWRALSVQELVDGARLLARVRPPSGGVAIVTNAGGPGVAATDALVESGLRLADFSPYTRDRLRDRLPGAGSSANPVDLLASAGPSLFADALGTALDDEDTGSALVLLPTPPAHPSADVAEAIARVAAGSHKPVLPVLLGEDGLHGARDVFRKAGVASFRFIDPAVRALAGATAQGMRRPVDAGSPDDEDDAARAVRIGAPADPALPGEPGWMNDEDGFALLASAGIPVVAGAFAASGDDAAREAARLGYPVAVKASVSGLLHKAKADALALDLRAESDVREAFLRFSSLPDFRGVLVQPMVHSHTELFVGVARDAQFGPLVALGGGGTEVEAEADITCELAPCTIAEAEAAWLRTHAGRRLASSVRTRMAQIVVRVAQLAREEERLETLDINPVVVLNGIPAALDVRVLLRNVRAYRP